MGSKYQLIYEGPVDNTPETIDKLKHVFSETNTHVSAIQEASPCIIETSADENELKALFEKILSAGGKVKIEELLEDSTLSVDHDELWQKEYGLDADNILNSEDVEPLEFELEGAKTRTSDDDSPLFTEEQLQNTEPSPKEAVPAEEFEFSLELAEPVETKELVDEIIPEQSEEEVGDLAPASEEELFSFDSNEPEDAKKAASEVKSAPIEQVEAKEDLGLAFDGEESKVQPQTKNDKSQVKEEAGLSFDEGSKEAAASENTNSEKKPPKKQIKEGVSLASLTKQTLDVSTQAFEDEEEYVEEVAEEESGEQVLAKSPKTSLKKKQDQKQLTVLAVVLFALGNVLYFNFFASGPQKPALDLSAMSQVKTVQVSPPAEETVSEKVKVFKDYTASLQSETVSIEAKFTMLKNEFMTTSVLITTPRPPERSAKDKAFGVKPNPWLRKIEVDRLQLEMSEGGKVAGTGRARAYIIQDPERTRIVSSAKLSGTIIDETFEGSILVSNLETVQEPELVEVLEVNNKTEDSFEIIVQVPFTAYLTERAANEEGF